MSILRSAFVLSLALVTATIMPVTISHGPLASSALAAPRCGGENQRACKVYERPGRPCNGGLVEVTSNPLDPNAGRCVRKNASRRGCGKQGQRACTIIERPGRPCDGGLVEKTSNYLDPTAGRCQKYDPRNPGTIIDNVRDLGNVLIATSTDTVTQVPAIINLASRDAGRLAPLSAELARSWVGCVARFKGLKSGSGQLFYDAIVDSGCLDETLETAHSAGYRTVTIGIAGSGGAGVGVEIESGLAFDTARQLNTSYYETQSLKLNSYGLGSTLAIGLWRAPNSDLGGDAQGIAGGIAAFGGSGGGIWYDYDQNFAGFTVGLTAGAEGEAAYVRNSTKISPTNIGPEPKPSDKAYVPERQARPDTAELGSPPPDPTELKICNRSGEPQIYTALAYWDAGARHRPASWTSDGWLEISNGQCRTITLPDDETGGPYGGDVYLMGRAEMMDWDLPDTAFCVGAENDFEYRDADRMTCNGPDRRLASQKFEVKPSARNSFDFNPGKKLQNDTLLSICNDTSRSTIRVGMASFMGDANGGFVSQGWRPVARGECRELKLVDRASGKPKDGFIYLTALSDTASYGYGAEKFCFDTKTNFQFRNAKEMDCSGHRLMDTAEVRVTPGNTSTFRFHD
ncbi:MAG: DUF1036 domain-containing protein [Parvularculaceae bacterium]